MCQCVIGRLVVSFIHFLQTGLQDSKCCGCLNHGPCASVVKDAAPGDCPFVFTAWTMPDVTIQHKPYCQWVSCQKGVESKSMRWTLVIRRAERAHAIEKRPK